jgi:4-hydroxybenzoate polyprenyltransferase
MRIVARCLIKLTRLDTSLLVALSVFIPLIVRTKNLGLSLSHASPLLFIGMCTFIANDLDDIERDRINHPERPLPSGHLTTSFAAALYFSCLAAALLTTRYYIDTGIAFLYYLLLVLSISYGYVVDYFPGLKSPYVSCATSIPILIVAFYYPTEGRLYFVAAAVFFFVLGRELCMDLVDRTGDSVSFMHRISKRPLSVVAFCSQAIGLLLLAVQTTEPLGVLDVLLVGLFLVLAGRYWFKVADYSKAITLMKLQLFAGLYFLT